MGSHRRSTNLSLCLGHYYRGGGSDPAKDYPNCMGDIRLSCITIAGQDALPAHGKWTPSNKMKGETKWTQFRLSVLSQ